MDEPGTLETMVGAPFTRLTFEEADGSTRLTLQQLFPSEEALNRAVASGMERGMRETFEQLDTLVALAGGGPYTHA
jgi:uncharacterized protein YndB with AHSA1/START domain